MDTVPYRSCLPNHAGNGYTDSDDRDRELMRPPTICHECQTHTPTLSNVTLVLAAVSRCATADAAELKQK